MYNNNITKVYIVYNYYIYVEKAQRGSGDARRRGHCPTQYYTRYEWKLSRENERK